MIRRVKHIDLSPRRVWRKAYGEFKISPNYFFYRDVAGLIVRYWRYSLTIVLVTIFQEVAALWPVSLLGQFVDRLQTGDLGNVVWLLLGSTLLYPVITRANIILRHKMFYQTDFQRRAEMTIAEADDGKSGEVEAASAAHTSILNAVAGITNAAYHILGSFTPVIIKIAVVSGNLLAYNRTLGLVYLASLLIPTVMTFAFNSRLRVLQNTQYSVINRASGLGVKVIADCANTGVRERFMKVMTERRDVFIALVTKSQIYILIREAALVGSQFLVVFMALGMRERIGLTPGDFTKIVGYTAQVAAAFITTATVLDAIVSYSRAYYVYAQERRG